MTEAEELVLQKIEAAARHLLKYGDEQRHAGRVFTVYPSRGLALYEALREADALRDTTPRFVFPGDCVCGHRETKHLRNGGCSGYRVQIGTGVSYLCPCTAYAPAHWRTP